MTDETREHPRLPELEMLPKETAAPAELEERVVAALRREGLLAPAGTPRSRSFYRWAAVAAAAVVLFLAGWMAGSRATPQFVPPEPTFVLLLREGPNFQAATQSRPEAELVEEYRAWAGGQARAGRLVGGEKLGEEARWLARAPAAASEKGTIGGFFLLTVRNLDEAVAVAQSCPHLKYGGRIEVRPIDPT